MGKFNEYSQKTTPEDTDSLMIYDAAAKANKLSPFSGIWNWIVGKLTNAVIANLQTNNKTVLGAINELNSNRAFVRLFDNGSKSDTVIFTLKPSFIYQDIIFCGSLSSFGTISLMNGSAPKIYTNGENDGILKVKSVTKKSITLEITGYSRVSFFSYWDFSVSA